MGALTDYIAGRGEAPSPRKLNRMIEQWEWFTTARRARALVTGEPDAALILPLPFWPTNPPITRPPDPIDRFIEYGDYKIIPTDEVLEVEVEVEIDPEMVSVELAEIYRKQGLTERADEIYRILSLRNS